MDKHKNIERQRPGVIGMYHQWLLLQVPETVTMYDQHDCPKDIGMRAAHYDHDEPVGLLVWDAKLLFLLSSRSRTCSCKVGQLKASQSDLSECVCACACAIVRCPSVCSPTWFTCTIRGAYRSACTAAISQHTIPCKKCNVKQHIQHLPHIAFTT